MPTENRSSNTEIVAKLSPCPYCGQQDAFVEQLDSDASVVICQGRIDKYSACLARGPVGVQQHECEDQPGRDQAVKEWNKRAVAQNHPEPIAWMVGTAFWWTKEEAERDAAETGLTMTPVGPINESGKPTVQHQGEPVAWVRFRNGEPDYDGDACMIMNVAGDTLGDGDSWEPVYTHADRGEVERLQGLLNKVGKSCKDQLAIIEGLRDKLAERDALLRDALASHGVMLMTDPPQDPWKTRRIGERIGEALSASAEPSAPIAWHVGGNGYDRICFEEPTDLPGCPCIQAIHDQRQLIELLKRYDLRDEEAPLDERAHGVPGTSFQRMNALANKGE